MTSLQFAKAECANYEPNGGCAGVGIRENGSLYSFGRKPNCVLGTPGIRCEYFEQCVAPLRERSEVPLLRKEYEEAWDIYRKAGNVPSAIPKPCRQCGKPRRAGKQLCDACATANQREANRRKNLK